MKYSVRHIRTQPAMVYAHDKRTHAFVKALHSFLGKLIALLETI